MGFIDYFVKPEETTTPQTVAATPVQVAPAMPTVNLAAVNIPQSTVSTTECSDDMVKTLWQVLIDKNLPGPDFLELKQHANALSSLGISIEQQYEGAFNVLKTQTPTFTKQIVLDSIDTYINIVNEEKKYGDEQCKAKRAAAIGEKQTRVAQLQETGNDILKQIEELKKQHDECNKSIAQLQNEIVTSTAELDKQEQLFNNSINAVINSLNTDKQKISTLNI